MSPDPADVELSDLALVARARREHNGTAALTEDGAQ